MTGSTPYDPDIAPAAALLADPTRAAMLTALLDGRPLAAGELARISGVSAATASEHLAKLTGGGMLTVARQGRHRYYQLAGHEVAVALEAVGMVSRDIPVRTLRQSREAQVLAAARTCYDHLAGEAGVALLQALIRVGALAELPEPGTGAADPQHPGFEVTPAGEGMLGAFGINIEELRRERRQFAAACLDWTQRRTHLSGSLAAAITRRLFELGWIVRGNHRRSVVITPDGETGLVTTFGYAPA